MIVSSFNRISNFYLSAYGKQAACLTASSRQGFKLFTLDLTLDSPAKGLNRNPAESPDDH
jgi:hypothetical protein